MTDIETALQLMRASLDARLPMLVADYAGVKGRLEMDLTRIIRDAMDIAYDHGVKDTEEGYANELSTTSEGRRILDEMDDRPDEPDDIDDDDFEAKWGND